MIQPPNKVIDRPKTPGALREFLGMLRPKARRWGVIRAKGRWGVSFRERQDLLFFRVDCGECQFIQAGAAPLRLASGDFILARTSAPFSLASDRGADLVDSWALVATTRSTEICIGDGEGEPVIVRGGRFVFDIPNEKFLLGLLPPLVHLASRNASFDRVCTLLAMNEAECAAPGLGSEFVIGRLMELLFVELIRGEALALQPSRAGLLAAFADPVTARALAALHGNMAHPWTAPDLARLCGCSRSAFSARFTKVVGVAPMSYLQQWRIAVAKDELRSGSRSVAEIGFLVGFQSGSAFSTAFTRAVGCSPTCFARGLQR
jgi:AraC-like DNA-binding protein